MVNYRREEEVLPVHLAPDGAPTRRLDSPLQPLVLHSARARSLCLSQSPLMMCITNTSLPVPLLMCQKGQIPSRS